MIRVSCILPIYNAERYLNNTLELLLNQTLREIEIICVNDCSDDNTWNILLEKQINDERIVLVNELEHKGAAACRNVGLEKAKGDFVIFLDSDDYFYEGMLENAYRLAVDREAELVVFGYEEARIATDQDNNEIITNIIIHRNRYEEISNFEVNIETIKKANCVPWNKLIRRDFLIEKHIIFQDIPSNNDIFFAVTTTIQANKIVFSDMVSLRYYYGFNDSLTFKRFNKKNYLVEAYSKLLDYINVNHISNVSWGDMLNYILDNIEVHFACPEYSKSVKEDTYQQILKNTVLMNAIREAVDQKRLSAHNIVFGKEVLNNTCVIERNNYFYYLGGILPLFNHSRANGEKIALWGCGVVGKRFLDLLNDENIMIDYVIDSDKDKQGTYYKGYLIHDYYSIEDMVNIVLVLNSKLADDVKRIAVGKKIVDISKL